MANTGSKYNAQKKVVGNINFDSKKEAARFVELKEMLDNGEISDLRLQQNFTLLEGFTTPDGERIRPIVYKADFVYTVKKAGGSSKRIVEDVKSQATRTPEYSMKRKLLADKYGVIIKEI